MTESYPKRHRLPFSLRVFIFNRIKTFSIFLPLFFLFIYPLRGEEAFNHSKWDHLLKHYVHSGLVDYESLLQARGELDDYLKQIESISIDAFSEFSREDRIAFWINLYNASVVRMILDEHPVERFDEIPAGSEIRIVQAIGEFFSLSELRDQILRKGFRDERILIALVSGRMDSPKLLDEAFRGDTLEKQLNRVAHEFVEDETRNEIKLGEKKIFLSPLFRNFGSDFLLNFSSSTESQKFSQIETAVIGFILRHLSNPDKRLFLDSGRYKIQYLPENPKLNRFRNSGM